MCPSSYVGFPGDSCGKEPAWQCRRLKRYEIFVCFVFFLKRYEFDPWVGWRRSPGGAHGNPLWYSCLESPWTEQPGRLQSIGSQRVRHNWSNLACTHTKVHTISNWKICIWFRFCRGSTKSIFFSLPCTRPQNQTLFLYSWAFNAVIYLYVMIEP